jgi:hypothetical protein
MLKLDKWQEEVLKTKGNLVLRSGRQVGKSTIVSIKAGEFAVKTPNKTVMVIASVERQSYLLFEKILAYIYENYKDRIKLGKDRPTKHKVTLKNGSVIYSLPTGMSGAGIRGFTVHLLIADEAAFIPQDVWTAVTPMLAITRGIIWLLSTPLGKRGYFYACFNDERFTHFHISSEECPRADHDFLKAEKERMTKLQYAQEYLGLFVDELQQFFPTKIIEECMKNDLEKRKKEEWEMSYLGCDIARMGGDEATFISLVEHKQRRGKLKQIGQRIEKEIRATDLIRVIKELDTEQNYKKIIIDSGAGGGGAAILDCLLEETQVRRKVIGINNAQKSVDMEKKRKRKIIKEDLYHNLLILMERGMIELLQSPEMRESLISIQYEIKESGEVKIFGKYTHLVEGLIRAAWGIKQKGLNLWIR